ncbi:MAG: hypothetical protein H6Q25_108 [Bacteroidetes bacterium]|nr:hypothetical protein [Bacteroidota bacterium]
MPIDRLSFMKRFILLLLIATTIILGFVSCSKPIEFKVHINNNTSYTIDILEFSGSISGPAISIPPMSSSESFYITYTESFNDLIEEPECLISISKYTGPNGTKTNTIWRYFKINEFSTSEDNAISIQLDPLSFYENDIFQFITN